MARTGGGAEKDDLEAPDSIFHSFAALNLKILLKSDRGACLEGFARHRRSGRVRGAPGDFCTPPHKLSLSRLY